MPKKVVSAATMQIGKKGKGKHWTKAQVDARREAAERMKRDEVLPLLPLTWLNKQAVDIWKRKLLEVKGLKASEELLDVLDSESLAIYCDACVQYSNVAKKKQKSVDDIKELQAWARIISSFADKLGFNPSARARLVKKIVEDPEKDKFGKEFD
jgi:phage terminase small subunit